MIYQGKEVVHTGYAIEIEKQYKQTNQILPSSIELEDVYQVNLTTEDKINVLKVMCIEINQVLSEITDRKQRIPELAKRQVLEECIDILEKYHAVERTKQNDI